MYLISPHKKQYKANLHCHSVISDGKKTPEELKEMYKNHGYSILAITDHETPCCHSDLDDENFLTITGYEGYIRNNPRYDAYGTEIHLNLFARDPKNETLICYQKEFCKYTTEEQQAKFKKVVFDKPRACTVEYVNDYIRIAKENGYIVAFNHPYWSFDTTENILAYEGFFSMEMCNYGSYLSNGLEYNGALYNELLRNGKRIFCHSADDNHNGAPDDSPLCDSFGGFTMIMPDDFTYDGVISAMEKGEMYSSMGPVFKEVSIEGNRLHIECSDVKDIIVHNGGKRHIGARAATGKLINSADFELKDGTKFVRVTIIDKDGKCADTRGFFRGELEF